MPIFRVLREHHIDGKIVVTADPMVLDVVLDDVPLGVKLGQVPAYVTDVTLYVRFSDDSQRVFKNAPWHPQDGSMMIDDVTVNGMALGTRYTGCHVTFTFWGKSRTVILDAKGQDTVFGKGVTLTLTNLIVKFI